MPQSAPPRGPLRDPARQSARGPVRDLASLSSSLGLVDEVYEQYRRNPASVDPGWRALFDAGDDLAPPPATGAPGPARVGAAETPAGQAGAQTGTAPGARATAHAQARASAEGLSVWPLVNAYRVRGHMAAALDPLDLMERPTTVELEPATYGFSDADLDRELPGGGLHGVDRATLRQILDKLKATYASSIGVEFMHISVPLKKRWLADRMERMHEHHTVDPDTRREMLRLVIAAETLESFCHVKFPGTKRFSLEGCEGTIPLLDLALTHAARLGAIEAVIGMAHRGRLNVLVHTLGRAPRDLFAEFEDIEPEATMGGGDVKYHLGYSSDRTDRNGRQMHLSLAFNPSHLEAVDPVVVGRVRAKQRRHGDWEHSRVLGVLLHGDAAFAGQGLVAETLNLTGLHGYRTGGTLHIIVNNQIGFTASPVESRSTPYCTDIAKMIQCPIFHVNGEDLDAVAHVVKIAMEYRAQFKSDVVIDLYGYRKFGHNEMDEPGFTQPQMYERIKRKRRVDEVYADRLLAEGVVTEADVEAMRVAARDALERELELGRAAMTRPRIQAMRGVWSEYVGGVDAAVPEPDTGVGRERLAEIAARMTAVPEGVTPHRKIQRLLAQRAEMGQGTRPIDWGMGELFAYGSLLWEGANVRLSGQDSSRGTFSHRHALIVDQRTGAEHMLLGHLHPDQGVCRIYDSPLSEAGVLGFEWGYSLDFPDALVIWEAQFGDFANGAQVIFDQFIVASEDKWNRLSGLVVFLPHGYEGQGPEHSSARIERFLQSAAEDNIQVCQPTTPAQMFHMLRRQVVRPLRKPLIVFTPKSLLRLPEASSSLDDLATGRFRRILPDPAPPPARAVDRVFLCSGKLYYELERARRERGDGRTALVRVEQLYPLADDDLSGALAAYPEARALAWVQDEPANMGAAEFMMARLRAVAGGRSVRLVARDASASPATGSHKAHVLEHSMLMDRAFGAAD